MGSKSEEAVRPFEFLKFTRVSIEQMSGSVVKLRMKVSRSISQPPFCRPAKNTEKRIAASSTRSLLEALAPSSSSQSAKSESNSHFDRGSRRLLRAISSPITHPHPHQPISRRSIGQVWSPRDRSSTYIVFDHGWKLLLSFAALTVSLSVRFKADLYATLPCPIINSLATSTIPITHKTVTDSRQGCIEIDLHNARTTSQNDWLFPFAITIKFQWTTLKNVQH